MTKSVAPTTESEGVQSDRYDGALRMAGRALLHRCVEVAWALQPFDNGYATDLQEGNLLEW